MRALAAVPFVLAVLLFSACSGKDDGDATGEKWSIPTVSESGTSRGGPKADPCDMLTKEIAEDALGEPVGESQFQLGEDSVSCGYGPADNEDSSLVVLTTFPPAGRNAFDKGLADFPNAKRVPNLGTRSFVSAETFSIGVSDEDLLFTLTIVSPGLLDAAPSVVEEKLIKLARAVFARR